MLLQLIIFLFSGIFAGVFTGLLPGIHINLVGAILVSLSIGVLSSINSVYLVVFLVAMSITHTFIDFIPSIFLGAPDTDTVLSVLPGHEMLKSGFGFQAVKLTALGGLIAVISFVIISVPFIFLIPKIYSLIKILIPYILILVSLFLIFTEKNKFAAMFVFFLAGILGLITLNLQSLKEPLLPLLTGLFGASTIALSINQKVKIPPQKTDKKINIRTTKPLIISVIVSPISIFLPAISSGQIAIIGNSIAKTSKQGFLFLQGSVNVLAMAFSFLSLYTISKTRTGSAVVIKELVGVPETNLFIFLLIIILISGIASYFLSLKIAKVFAEKIPKINYTLISVFTLVFVSLIVLIFSGLFGFLVFTISTATGIYCISLNVNRTNMMGCLLLPTIILYLL